jgi:hypothetical protein
MGDLGYRTLRDEVYRRLFYARTDASVEFHELSYPAVAIDTAKAVGALLSGGSAFSYGESERTGVAGLKQYVSEQSGKCPEMRFVLAGYSQGAQVVADSLTSLDKSKIVYVALFGEPKLYLPEGFGVEPAACRGEGISPYNVWAPNCYTYVGSLRERAPYHPNELIGRVGLWCNNHDFVCGSTMNFNDLSGHLEYATNGRIGEGAGKIVDKIVEDFPRRVEAGTGSEGARLSALRAQAPMDVAIVIDSTESMFDEIEGAKNEALDLAREIWGKGGRVALIEYRDFEDVGYPRLLCDFYCGEEALGAVLGGITAEGGGDRYEGLLAAMMLAYNELDWEIGASKSLVVLTDTGFHSPDKSGVTYGEVVARSLTIDPVNTYILIEARTAESNPEILELEKLASDTGGKVFLYERPAFSVFPSGFWWDVVGYLSERPVAVLRRAEYAARVGQEITFNASESFGVGAEIVRYEWDFNGDGIYEEVSGAAVVRHVYNSAFSGFMVVKVVDGLGRESTMAAKVEVYDSLPERKVVLAPEEAWVERVGEDRVRISWAGARAKYVMVSINGVMLGYVEASLGSVEVFEVDFKKIVGCGVRGMAEEGELSEEMIARERAAAEIVGGLEEVENADRAEAVGEGGELRAPVAGYGKIGA